MKTRFLVIINILLLPVILTACSRTSLLNITTSSDEKQCREMVDKVFRALDSDNKEELKKLFAKSVIKKDSDIDSQIDALFEYYKGPKESDEEVGDDQTNEEVEYGKKKIEINDYFTVHATGVKHNIYLSMQSVNDFDKNEVGIHKLEFDSDEAINGKYFMYYTQDGVHIQTSSEKRSDVTKVDSWMLDYTFVKRDLTSDDYVTMAKKDNDFKHYTTSVGMANCSNKTYGRYYYELGKKKFLVCIVENGKIEFIKLANEDKIFSTIWIAPDRIKVEGEYRQYTKVDRGTTLNESSFKKFFLQSNKLKKLIKKIGMPNGDNKDVFYAYYKISDNRFVVCECTTDGKNIVSAYVADSDHKLYSIWEQDGNK